MRARAQATPAGSATAFGSLTTNALLELIQTAYRRRLHVLLLNAAAELARRADDSSATK